jgi:4'-phosphopantetheinyl transferase
MGLASARGSPDVWVPSPREVHVWVVDQSTIADDTVLDRYHAVMAPAERIQQARFYFARDRHRYLVTRALVRSVLSHYTGVPPAVWRFAANEYGRPAIAEPADFPAVRFNLSHTTGMILCAVAFDHEVGVDVEDTTRPGETVSIANRYFSPSEVRDLHAVPEAEQRARFFEYWTLKESYIKARGMGLSLPLEQFSFGLRDRGTIGIAFDARLRDRPRDWQFGLWRPTARHQVALAVRRIDEENLVIRIRRTVPLVAPGAEEQWSRNGPPPLPPRASR